MDDALQKKIEKDDLVCLKLVSAVLPFCQSLNIDGEDQHGNRRLFLSDVLLVLLAAFFNPAVRSLRIIEQLSQMQWIEEKTDLDRICRSTLSDALSAFDPTALAPLIAGLMQQIPHLSRRDKALADVCRQVVAADGSTFSLAADVAWAMMRRRGGGKGDAAHGTCRLNMQLYIDSFTPAALSVSGCDEGSEAAAFMKDILSGVIYLLDRNFMHFGLLNRVLDCGSDFVLRLRADTKFQLTLERPLYIKDVEAGVLSDRVGSLPGSRDTHTGPPPQQAMREIMLMGDDGKPLRLLTNILDLPAHVIAELYRRRWQVELFFRWLKVWAGFEHLFSHSQNGVTFQFYVSVIACLLMYVRTGRKVNKYSLFLFGQVAAGLSTLQQILPMLEKIEHEKELERQRLARKKQQKKLEDRPAKIPAKASGR